MLKSKWFTPPNAHIAPIKQQWLQIKFFFFNGIITFLFLTRHLVKNIKQAFIF